MGFPQDQEMPIDDQKKIKDLLGAGQDLSKLTDVFLPANDGIARRNFHDNIVNSVQQHL